MGNISKTMRYLKRNGLLNTGYAILERLLETKDVPYRCVFVDDKTAKLQRDFSSAETNPVIFSILVPIYETNPEYLKKMIQSCLDQTYPFFELILADASVSDNPKNIIASYSDDRIKYIRIEKNEGISANTNVALNEANGDYCVLLDHDDFLTVDALYENYRAIKAGRENGVKVKLLYSDEDKCNGEGNTFYEPHYKHKLNLDLLMSNNYICHLTVMEAELMKELQFRSEYDGSQDHDLVLRAVEHIMPLGKIETDEIVHISKVLYHWRCHEGSTASNPASKNYAYDAGRRAIEDFARKRYTNATVEGLMHLGYFRVNFEGDIFRARPDVGAIGGNIYSGNKITGGIYNEAGICPFMGLNKHFSGYRHEAVLMQDAQMLDIRNMKVCTPLQESFDRILAKYNSNPTTEHLMECNREFAELAHKSGFFLLFDPIFKKS